MTGDECNDLGCTLSLAPRGLGVDVCGMGGAEMGMAERMRRKKKRCTWNERFEDTLKFEGGPHCVAER